MFAAVVLTIIRCNIDADIARSLYIDEIATVHSSSLRSLKRWHRGTIMQPAAGGGEVQVEGSMYVQRSNVEPQGF
jgi:hypothetical protein